MNVLEARVTLRTRSVAEIFDLAVRFLAAHGRSYGRVALVVLLPAFLATWLVGALVHWALAWALALALRVWVTAPFTVLASRLVFDANVPTREPLARAARTTLRLLGAQIVRDASMAAASIAAFVALWPATSWGFATEAILLEDASVGGALGRSSRIAQSRFGEAIGVVLLLALLAVVFIALGDNAGGSLMTSLLQMPAPKGLFESGGSPFALLGYWLFRPFVATARLFAYLDFRTRSEGWDIQARFSSIRARLSEQGVHA